MDVAVLVDGCRPIGARVRRIPEPELRLLSLGGVPRGEAVAELVCRELEDLRDYCQPHAPGEVAPSFVPNSVSSWWPQAAGSDPLCPYSFSCRG